MTVTEFADRADEAIDKLESTFVTVAPPEALDLMKSAVRSLQAVACTVPDLASKRVLLKAIFDFAERQMVLGDEALTSGQMPELIQEQRRRFKARRMGENRGEQ